MVWIVFFFSPHADHITFLTGFTFLPRGALSRCCINDSELYSSTAASLYWFCGLIIKNTPLWWHQNSCSSLHELGIQCSLTYATLWVMWNLSPLITSLTFGRKQHFLLKVLFLFFIFCNGNGCQRSLCVSQSATCTAVITPYWVNGG